MTDTSSPANSDSEVTQCSNSDAHIAAANSSAKKGIPSWLKTTLAIVMSAAILFYYFKDVDWRKFVDTLMAANLWMAFFAVLLPQLVMWLFGVYQNDRTFTWFHKPFAWIEYTWVKGALYLIMMINTGLGGAGNAIYLQQKTQITWTKIIAMFFFRGSVQLAAVGLCLIPLTIGMHLVGVFEKTPINPVIWWSLLIGGQLLFWDGWFYFLHNKPIGLSRFWFQNDEANTSNTLSNIRNKYHPFWQTYRTAEKRQWLWMMVWAPVVPLSVIVGYWFLIKAFNVEIPMMLFVVTILLVALLQDIPIAFAGFGSTTVAWTMFYGDYMSLETIAGLTLVLPLLRLMVRAAIGVISIRPAISDISAIIAEYQKGNRRLGG